MEARLLHRFIIYARPSNILPSTGIVIPKINRSYSFVPPRSLIHLRRVVFDLFLSGELSTYHESVDLIDNQSSFDFVFRNSPTMLRITRRSVGICDIEDTVYMEES